MVDVNERGGVVESVQIVLVGVVESARIALVLHPGGHITRHDIVNLHRKN